MHLSLRHRHITAAGQALTLIHEYDPEGQSARELAAAINSAVEGWTIDVPAPRGAVLRTSGVVFSPAELDRVIAAAESYATLA